MIWLLFAGAAGLATWAAAAMRSGALDPARGRPLALGSGVTAAVLLALIVYDDIQQRRMVGQIVGATTSAFDRVGAGTDAGDRVIGMDARRERFDRDFQARQDEFDRSFKEQADSFSREFTKRQAALGAPARVGEPVTGETK